MNKTIGQLNLTEEIVQGISTDRKVRIASVRQSFFLFFLVYFKEILTYGIPDFQKEMFALMEDDSNKLATIMAFRDSAKSTILSQAYPIWAISGIQQKKFVLIVARTQEQARLYLDHIKNHLTRNVLLKSDLGPFEVPDDEWRANSIVLPWYGARITVGSVEQSIRGIRHNNHRPDLIICDDLEDVASARTKEGRDKVFNWLSGELIPAGTKDTKIVIIGNLVHENCLPMRIKKNIELGKMSGVFKAYPLVDANGVIAWPGKYQMMADVEDHRKKIGNDPAWMREFMLKIISDDNQIIRREWIKHYEAYPQYGYRYSATGIDPAISLREGSDPTGMVSGRVYGWGKDMKIFILPNPVNERMDFIQTVKRAMLVSEAEGNGNRTELFVESVAYQRSLAEQLRFEGFPAKEFNVGFDDKESRLRAISFMIQSGAILFPKEGAEDLIEQLVNFGVDHDDLADAFVILVRAAMSLNRNAARTGMGRFDLV